MQGTVSSSSSSASAKASISGRFVRVVAARAMAALCRWRISSLLERSSGRVSPLTMCTGAPASPYSRNQRHRQRRRPAAPSFRWRPLARITQVAFGQPDPFRFALIEAEVAARSRPPLIVCREANAGVRENSHHSILVNSVFDERKPSLDIRLGGDVALAVRLISTNRNVGKCRRFADPFLERLNLHVLGAPSHLRRGQRPTEHLEPVVESALSVETDNRLAEDHFETVRYS